MSRKTATFGALVAYADRINAADQRFALHHNLHAQTRTAVVDEFEANGRLMKDRKNGVVMYHEIISITRAKGISADAQKEVLRRIALDYLDQRAPHCLGYGMLHDDHKGHLHYHLILSANESGVSKRHSLTRNQFRKIQVELEQRVLKTYPQLEQQQTIGKKAAKKQSQAGVEMTRRGASKSHVESLKERARQAFLNAQSADQLFALLTDARLELYSRGKAVGLRDLDRDRNHRLETLELMPAFDAMRQRFHQPIQQSTPSPTAVAVMPSHSQPATHEAIIMSIPPVIEPAQLKGKSKAARLMKRALQGAEKVVGAVAREGGAIANQVLGGAVKHTTGMIETAVHTIGGPKPHAQQKQDQLAREQATQAPVSPELVQAAKQAMTPFNPSQEIEALAKARQLELEKERQAEFRRQLKRDGLSGPKQLP